MRTPPINGQRPGSEPESEREPERVPDPLLSPKNLAAQEKITKGWLDKARCRGDGPPFYRIGGRIYYRRSEYLAWLEQHRHTSTSTY
ncbi:MAG: helix-turn-helix domain-containing protein [Minwuia sp.]|nr:helix-turn-helix domain-containing protein [Minwuia sp.]